MRRRDVAAAARTDRHVRAAAVAARHVDHAVVKCRGGNRELVRAADVPKECAGARIVRVDALARIDDQLGTGRRFDDKRRRIRHPSLAAVYTPAFLARLLVDGEQIGGWRVIAQQEDGVAEQRRRARVPPVDLEGRDFLAEMPLPDNLAVHVERDDLARAEPGVDDLSVRHGAGARQVVLVVDTGQRSGRFQAVLPQSLAVAAAEGFDDEERAVAGRPALSGSERPLAGRSGSLREPWMIAGAADSSADL